MKYIYINLYELEIEVNDEKFNLSNGLIGIAPVPTETSKSISTILESSF